jgi:uncharacterized protein YkwD
MKTLILFLLISSFSFSQKVYRYDKWKASELKAAKNYTAISFLDPTEKEMLYYANLVRINPKLFCETYLQEYIDINHLDRRNTYVASLIKMLNNSKPSCVLVADASLQEMAKSHAVYMGTKGLTGHNEFDKRIKKYLKGKFCGIGENCSYGPNQAIDILMSFLIDEGVTSLGHRENLMNPDYNSVGISVKPHKTYGTNSVMDFGFGYQMLAEQ